MNNGNSLNSNTYQPMTKHDGRRVSVNTLFGMHLKKRRH